MLERLGAHPTRGLPLAEVAERQSRFGCNALAEAEPEPAWRRLLNQFTNLVIWILIVAAVMSGAMGEWADTAAILAIVLVNGIIGFLQEERAGRALAALQKLSSPTAKVIRDGQLQSIAAEELVPGDRIELEAGDSIPADARLLRAYGLRVQEAALTGESVPVTKEAGCVLEPQVPLGDRRNMVYTSTVVAAGKASAVVVTTGMQTELGQIAGLLRRSEPQPTPLQRRLEELGKILVAVCLGIVAVIFMLHMMRGGKLFEVFLIAVSLAVAAVPEGLPAVVTLALALGLQRMVQRNALVRKLPSVETLGSVTVICTDKTGTLTRNEMTVREVATADAHYHVTGSGYRPQGEFFHQATDQHRAGRDRHPLTTFDADARPAAVGPAVDPHSNIDLIQLLTIAARCNNASVNPLGGASNEWQVVGDPTEGALIVAALKAKVASDDRDSPVIYEIPFDSERKTMSVVVRPPVGSPMMYTKGATEAILAKCASIQRAGKITPLTEDHVREIMRANNAMARRALRVLAFAYRENLDHAAGEFQEDDLTFVGVVGMIDLPRDEVKDSVAKCRTAGILPVMITGDHPETALAIAQELGLATQRQNVMTGAELDAVSDEDLLRRIADIPVYARVSAEHKLRVVRAWKSRGEVVAMTGDGVNDAPAVKIADIGIAMGITGTDVTKEASDMVLTDDNFTSIVSAVEEGRAIFDNIQKFVNYLLSCNASEVLLMFFAALAGWPVPLAAIQLLWINLVTDGLPALALAMEPPEPDIMTRHPRPPHEAVITWKRGLTMLLQGALMASASITCFWLIYGGDSSELPRARTATFCVVAFSQLFLAICCRSQRYTMPQLGLFTNPHLLAAIVVSGLLQLSVVTLPFAQPVFEVATYLKSEWLLVLTLALLPVTVIELGKLVLFGIRVVRGIPVPD